MSESNLYCLYLPNHNDLVMLLSGNPNAARRGIFTNEGAHLAWIASQIPVGGRIVEIGSHRGKSAAFMGHAMKYMGNTTASIVCVDLWTKGAGRTFDHYSSQETWDIFKAQTAPISDLIFPMMNFSHKAARKYMKQDWGMKPIDFLFIDGCHQGRAPAIDYDSWAGYLASRAWVSFHDYSPKFPSVRAVVDKAIESGLYEPMINVDRIATLRLKA